MNTQNSWFGIHVLKYKLGFIVLTLLCLYPFFSPDPFADATKGDDRLPAGTEDYIHIRIQQRNGRKTLTTVQGISADYDKKKLVKAFKKVFLWLVKNAFHALLQCSVCLFWPFNHWLIVLLILTFNRSLPAMGQWLSTQSMVKWSSFRETSARISASSSLR